LCGQNVELFLLLNLVVCEINGELRLINCWVWFKWGAVHSKSCYFDRIICHQNYQSSWHIWKNRQPICFDENWKKSGKIMKIAFIWEITPRSTIDGKPSIIPRGNRFFRSAHTHLSNFTALRSNLTSCQYDRYPVRDLNCVRPEFKLGAVLLTLGGNLAVEWFVCLRSRVWVWSWKAAPLTGCLGCPWDLQTSAVSLHLSYVCLSHASIKLSSESSKSMMYKPCIWRGVVNITNG